jgi:hypothetical protein
LGAKLSFAASEKNRLAAEICVDILNWYMTGIRTEIFGEG